MEMGIPKGGKRPYRNGEEPVEDVGLSLRVKCVESRGLKKAGGEGEKKQSWGCGPRKGTGNSTREGTQEKFKGEDRAKGV